MRALAILIMLVPALPAQAQDSRLYNWSLAAAATSQTLDIASSWGGIEANPRLMAGRRFGWQAASIKIGVVGTGLLIQRYVLRRHPEHKRISAIVNFGMAGATTAVAVRNWRMR